MVKSTDHPDMTIAVHYGHKATTQHYNNKPYIIEDSSVISIMQLLARLNEVQEELLQYLRVGRGQHSQNVKVFSCDGQGADRQAVLSGHRSCSPSAEGNQGIFFAEYGNTFKVRNSAIFSF